MLKEFIASAWFGWSNTAGVGLIVIAAVIYIRKIMDARASKREDDRLTERLKADLEAELFGAPEGSDGRR